MASASEDPLRDAVRDWLSGDEEGRHILEKLASDPIDGTQLLMARLQGDQTPEAITAAVSGGQVGTIVQVASAQALHFGGAAPSVSPQYLRERLRLGWSCFHLATLISAHHTNPTAYPHPSPGDVATTVSEINDVCGTTVAPPLAPMSARNYLDYFVHRLEAKDPAGAAVFRLGGCLYLWWQVKGHHGDEMDQELWAAVDDAATELNYPFPGAADRVRALLLPLAPGQAANEDTPAMMQNVSLAILGSG